MWNSIADYWFPSVKPRDLAGFGVHVGAAEGAPQLRRDFFAHMKGWGGQRREYI